MRFYILSFCLLILSGAVKAALPDIVGKMHLDDQASSSVVKRVRSFMMNNNLGDPFNNSLPKPITIELSQALKLLPDKTVSWIKDFQKVLNIRVLDSSYNLRVDGLRYEVQDFNTLLTPSETSQRVEYVTKNSVRGVAIKADRIVFEVELKRTTSGEPIYFEIVIVAPVLYMNLDHEMQIPMFWASEVTKNGLNISLNQIDLAEVIKKISRKPEIVNIKIGDLLMPDVSIRVGHKTLVLDKKKIKNFLIKGQNDFKDAIIDLLNVNVDERFGNVLPETLKFSIPKIFFIADDIHSVFDLEEMKGVPSKGMLNFTVNAHFCDPLLAMSDSYCVNQKIEAKTRRKISQEDFNKSMLAVDDILDKRDASLAFSVGEHYLNELIEAADRAGVLNLNGEDFKLGDQRAFVLADEKGAGFSLYLDIIHTLEKRDQVLTGKKQLRFPVKLKVGVSIVTEENIPWLLITVLKVDTDSKLLLNGLSKYSLVSNLNSARFKQRILAQIHQEIGRFQNEILVRLRLNIFKDLYFEDATFLSDGYGRAMATIPLDGHKIIK